MRKKRAVTARVSLTIIRPKDNALSGLDPRIIGYAEDALSGKITVGNKVNLACERFVNDLSRMGSPDFPWVLDPEEASKPIRFIEKFIKPSDGRDAMELMPWQCFCEGNIYGWIDPETRLRKHRRALIVVGSGNGKTGMVAGNAIYGVSQEPVRGKDAGIMANSKEQSGIMYEDCLATTNANDALSRNLKALRRAIIHEKTGNRIRNFSSDFKKLDGLRLFMAILEEMHEYRDYKAIRQLRRNLRKYKNPLEIAITTMGTVLDGPLVKEYQLADQMLKGIGSEERNARLFAYIAEMDEGDNVSDSSLWIKANPSLGVLLELKDLQEAWRDAQDVPAMLSDFLNKTLNIFTKADEASYLDHKTVQKNNKAIDLEMVRGREAYGGFDMASSNDHCSAALEIPLDGIEGYDGMVLVIKHTWVPRTVAERDAEMLDYYGLAMQGYLTIIEGAYVKQEYIIEFFEKWSEIFDIRAIGYDPANATLLVRALTSWRGLYDDGRPKPIFTCDPVRQGALTLNAPMKHLAEMFSDGYVVHNNDPLFVWYLNNVKLRQDYKDKEKENWVPVKLGKSRKIDGFMAFVDAHTVLMRLCPIPGVELPEPEVEFYRLA